MPAKIARCYEFASESKPGKTYQTLEYTDGTHSCNCPGWRFKRKTAGGERTCIHTRYIDSGTARQHAVSIAEYNARQARADAEADRRANPDALGTSPAIATLTERPRRAIDLEDEA